MDYNFFQEKIIQNLDDMEDALDGYDLDDFYVTIEYDKEEGGFKASFFLNSDGELLAETEAWGSNKKSLIEDIVSIFGDDVDILN